MNGSEQDRTKENETAEGPPDWIVEVARLAALTPLDYDSCRVAEALRLGVRVSTLDDEVRRARPKDESAPTAGGGRPLSLRNTEPWAEPVDGATVLDELSATFSRYVALPKGAADAAALWSAHTYAFKTFPISPRLAITSPEKRCGKTTLMRLMAAVCERQLQAANITPAAVFRAIEIARPTLLVDEADTFLKKNDELRGVLNSGHAHDGNVIRTVGDDHEPRQFSTFSPCAIAMIGQLPDTLGDRSISIALRRRTAGEHIERLRVDRPHIFADLRRKLARFAVDSAARLKNADPAMPASLDDRAADNWRVLFAIADVAGGDWPARARAACAALNAEKEADADSQSVALLRDIQAIFANRGHPDKLLSVELCQALADDEASPWAAFGHADKPITVTALARLLKRFNIAPKVLREGAQIRRGYEREAFVDAWSRYLPPETPPQSVTPQQAPQDSRFGDPQTRNSQHDVADADPANPLTGQGVLRRNGSTDGVAPGEDQAGIVEVTL